MRVLAVSLSLSLSLCLVAGLEAQQRVSVPANVSPEGNSRGSIAGFDARFRQQVLIDGAALSALRGKKLMAVWLRRDTALGLPYNGSTGQVHIELSHASTTTLTPSPVFASNRGVDRTVVFDGAVTLPSTGAPPSPVPWSAPWAVRIGFTTPFPYVAGTLCMEVEGTPQTPWSLWSVDYDHEAPMGTVTPIGVACGDATGSFAATLDAWGRGMVPGSTFSLTSIGRASTPGVVMIGLSMQPLPVALDWLGASGCSLYLQPQVQVPGTYPPQWGASPFTAWHLPVQLPTDPTLLGGRFFAQAVNLEVGVAHSNAAGLTTTNALDITLAARPVAGVMTTVYSSEVPAPQPFPDSGRVLVSRGPLLQFEFQ